MNKYLAYLVYGLVFLACIIFLTGIITAGIASITCMEKIQTLNIMDCTECLKKHNFLIKTMPLISSISIVLATNFGAALGISLVQNGSNGRRFSGITKFLRPLREQDEPITLSEFFRIAACYIYIVGLLVSFVFYLLYKDDCTESIIPDLTKSLYGVIAGALAIILGVPPPKPFKKP